MAVESSTHRFRTPISTLISKARWFYPSPLFWTQRPATHHHFASIARAIRASVNAIDDGHIRSAVELIDSLPDITKVTPGFKSFLGADLAITSWAQMQINGVDWGKAIGKVERVRIPYAQFDGLCIGLPRTPDSSLEVIIGLTQDDMDRLVRDELFPQFAQFGSCC